MGTSKVPLDSYVSCLYPTSHTLSVLGLLIAKRKQEGKDQELIQSSTTPDQGHRMGK